MRSVQCPVLWGMCLLSLLQLLLAADSYETVMIFEIYSSGSRAPVNSDLFNESWVEKVGPGRITPVGMRQQYNLGAAVREKFQKLISNIVDLQHVKVYSSGRSRSLISATTHNQGLFPAGSRFGEDSAASAHSKLARLHKIHPEFSGNLDSSSRDFAKTEFVSEPAPVPVESVDQFEDFMFLPRLDKACPHAKELRDSQRYVKFTNIHLLLNQFREDLKETIDSIKFPSEGKTVISDAVADFYLKTSFALNHIWDVVYSSYQYFGVMPSNFSELLYLKLKRLASGLFYLKFSEERIRKLYTTKISQKIVGVLKELPTDLQKKETPRWRYIGFSGDDDTVGSFLHLLQRAEAECHFQTVLKIETDFLTFDAATREVLNQQGNKNSTLSSLESEWLKALKHFDNSCQPIPAYSSSLIFEVVRFQGDGSLHVKFLDKLEYAPVLGDTTQLPISQFVEMLENKGILDNFEELCGNKHFKIVKAGSFVTVMVILVLLICCARGQLLKYKRIEKHRENKTK